MAFLRRLIYHWQVHGVPRCAGYTCARLLWPWFDIGGNGEEPLCRECTDRFHSRMGFDDDTEYVYP